MNYLVVIYAIVLMFCIFIIVNGLKIYNKKKECLYVFIILTTVNIGIWILFELCIQLVQSSSWAFGFHEMKYFSILTLPTLLLALSYYTVSGKKLGFKQYTLLLSIPMVLIVAIATNHYHLLFRKVWEIHLEPPYHFIKTVDGPLFYVMVLYVYAILAITLIYLIQSYIKESKFYRSRIGYLIITFLVTISMNILFLTLENKIHFYIDFTPFSFFVSSLSLYYTFFLLKPNRMRSMARELLLNSIQHGAVFIERKGLVFDANKKFLSMVGYTMEVLFEKNIKESSDPIFRIIDERMKENNDNCEYEAPSFNSINHYVVTRKDVEDHLGNMIGYVVLFTNVTELRKMLSELQFVNNHDVLTGLYNRFYYESEIQLMDKPENYPLGLISGDLDGLKRTNDTLGHFQGDQLLIETAKILKNAMDGLGFVARMGGDEFVLVVPRCSDAMLTDIIDTIKVKCLEYKTYPIEISLGYAIKQSNKQSIRDTMIRAEEQMYFKKFSSATGARDNTITLLTKVIQTRHPVTSEHMIRLEKLAEQFASALDLNVEQRYYLKFVSQIHDIGIIGLPDWLLYYEGVYDETARDAMNQHSQKGYDLVYSITHMKTISLAILYHHERWDGKGYPGGIREDQIPFLARMIHIMDAFDAMINQRDYKKVYTKSEALKELIAEAGKQFDPELVRVFVQMHEKTD